MAPKKSRKRGEPSTSQNEEATEVYDLPVPAIIRNHQFLKFNNRHYSSREKAEFKSMLDININKTIQCADVVDWAVLDQISARQSNTTGSEEIRNILRMEYRLADGRLCFTSRAWSRLFSIREYIYREATLEFFSTYLFDDVNTDVEARTIRFQLCGVPREMSVSEFGLALGLYTPEEVRMDYYIDHLFNGIRQPQDCDLPALWNQISSYPWTSKPKSSTQLYDPVMRVIHRMISTSLTCRKESPEKVTQTDLYYLGCIVNRGLVNVPGCLARSLWNMARASRRTSSITGGQYVTRLARYFGNQTGLATCMIVQPEMRLLGVNWFRHCRLVDGTINLQWAPWVYNHDQEEQDDDDQEEEEAPAQHAGPAQQAGPAPSLSLDQRFDYFENKFDNFQSTVENQFNWQRDMMESLFGHMGIDYSATNARYGYGPGSSSQHPDERQ